VTPTLASSGVRVAPLLPEIQHHIADAQAAIERGDFGVARGHAQAVLLGDELTYEVSFVSTSETERPNCMKALDAALAVWQREMTDTLRFREVEHGDHPEISIVFKPSVLMGQEQVAGFTNWQRRIDMDGSKWIDTTFHADMQLRTRDLDYKPMSFEAMRHEACHETGHVLGLDDSEHRGDLMGPLEIAHPVNGPTALEAASVRNLRDEARRLAGEAESRETGKL
jgi:hypothetical protein